VDTLTSEDGWRAVDWSQHTRNVALESGQRISCVELGSGPLPPLLLVHGLGASWHVWLQNLPALAVNRRVVAVDLPGFGSSPPPGGGVSYRAYADTLAGLARALQLGDFVVAGNSFGGWISAELARNCQHVVGLVLIDAVGMPQSRRERARLMTMMHAVGRTAGFAVRHRQRIASSPGLRRRAFAMMMEHPELLTADLALQLLPTAPSPVFRKVLATAPHELSATWAASLSKLSTPTLIIWGADDRQLPPRQAYEWHRLLTHSTLEVLAATGHVPMIERPAEVNALVASFLATVPVRHGGC
jgi:pimeloyl-ACP methyl ester carboxylesterase